MAERQFERNVVSSSEFESALPSLTAWQVENSTVQQERPEEIGREITILFEAAKEQVFEDGMESEFSKELIARVKKYGDAAMEVVADLITNERVNAEVASEALRWLGRMDHSTSYHFRRWLLERSLGCSSAMVRDGAALGLASLDDPHATPYLGQAILRERGTPDEKANVSWHCDLVELSAFKVVELAKVILPKAERKRIPETEIRQLIIQAIASGRIESTELQESIRGKIGG